MMAKNDELSKEVIDKGKYKLATPTAIKQRCNQLQGFFFIIFHHFRVFFSHAPSAKWVPFVM